MKEILTLDPMENFVEVEQLENFDFSKHNDVGPSMYNSILLDK